MEEILSAAEREVALAKMRAAARNFYVAAVQTHVHPFIEFTGLMNEYIKVCERAHQEGIDFSACNTHSGQKLPMRGHEIDYLNEKLQCIFQGHSVMNQVAEEAEQAGEDGHQTAANTTLTASWPATAA